MNTRRKAPPAMPTVIGAHSAYSASLGSFDPGNYRRTPPCQPTVAELVGPGATIRTSYGTGGIVVRIEPRTFTSRTGEVFAHHTIVYVPPDRRDRHRDSDLCWINECVAVNGRILMLFEANDDEVFVDRPAVRAPPTPPPIFIT